MGTDYDLLGSTDVLNELQNGRTRELLLLLQDSSIPDVVDPLNLQSGLSDKYTTDESGDYIIEDDATGSTVSRSDGGAVSKADKTGIAIVPSVDLAGITATLAPDNDGISNAYLTDDSGTIIDSISSPGDQVEFNTTLTAGTEYWLLADNNDNSYSAERTNVEFPITSADIDIVSGVVSGSTDNVAWVYKSVTAKLGFLTASVTDKYTAPTTPPADFKQWNAIRAEDVTTAGSTSPEPVEFEILDSTDTPLTSSRIPKSEVADSAFKFRDREYQTTASAGETQFTISDTGAGGHYGVPIFEVVTVEQNGNVLDPSAYEFDGTDTVILDSGASDGDTITLSYDLDVFGSTLQPRAYLNREDISENSPSISHFRYEYIV